MFDRILIANRGEVACRVIRTCRRLGVETAAVYAEAEGLPLHAEMADWAAALPAGANPVAEYLNIDAVVDAALKSGARAVHPGYGFLSENAAFAEACERAGVVFIGPPAVVIRAHGQQARGKAADGARGRPRSARRGRPRRGRDGRAGARRFGRIPAHGQGERGRRRHRDADGRQAPTDSTERSAERGRPRGARSAARTSISKNSSPARATSKRRY